MVLKQRHLPAQLPRGQEIIRIEHFDERPAGPCQEAVDDPQFHCPAHFLLMNYFAHSEQTAIIPNHEIVEWAWLAPEQALTYPLNTFTRTLVLQAMERDLPSGVRA